MQYGGADEVQKRSVESEKSCEVNYLEVTHSQSTHLLSYFMCGRAVDSLTVLNVLVFKLQLNH